LNDLFATPRGETSTITLESVARSIKSDIAILRYLEYRVSIAMVIAIIDTTAGTVRIADYGAERPVLIDADYEATSLPVDKFRTVTLQPGSALYFYTHRFFPPQVQSDTVIQTFFRRLALSVPVRAVLDSAENVAGTLIGVVAEDE
jgi:hypothetical protein